MFVIGDEMIDDADTKRKRMNLIFKSNTAGGLSGYVHTAHSFDSQR